MIDIDADLSPDDRALIAEALRRVQATRARPIGEAGAVALAIRAALSKGRRDLFGLFKAGCRAG